MSKERWELMVCSLEYLRKDGLAQQSRRDEDSSASVSTLGCLKPPQLMRLGGDACTHGEGDSEATDGRMVDLEMKREIAEQPAD